MSADRAGEREWRERRHRRWEQGQKRPIAGRDGPNGGKAAAGDTSQGDRSSANRGLVAPRKVGQHARKAVYGHDVSKIGCMSDGLKNLDDDHLAVVTGRAFPKETPVSRSTRSR